MNMPLTQVSAIGLIAPMANFTLPSLEHCNIRIVYLHYANSTETILWLAQQSLACLGN